MGQTILVDEIGYRTKDPKRALYRGTQTGEFSVVDCDSKEIVYTNTATRQYDCPAAGERHRVLEFDALNREGRYCIRFGEEESVPFQIGDGIYEDAVEKMLKFFYLQRCGETLPETYAGNYAHPCCHDTKAKIYGTESTIDVSGGWHDAGDFGRYIVPAAVTVADLLLMLETNGDFGRMDSKIPVTDEKYHALLTEIKYELDWMLKMQDPVTKEVYHKVTCASFCDFFMPEEEKEELIVSPSSYAATLDFAAAMAMAVRFYDPIDHAYGEKLSEASRSAYAAALLMEVKGFKNPEGIVTGEYGDEGLEDELYWASAELYRTFGEEGYRKKFEDIAFGHISHGYGWEDVYSFGNVAYINCEYPVDEVLKTMIRGAITAKADYLMTICRSNGYNVSFNEKSFIWGSNMYLIQNASHLYMAYTLTGKEEYLISAKEHMHYIFGKNPCNVCFLTGFGSNRVSHPHHRPSAAQSAPMQGMIIGGPDSGLHDPTAEEHCKGNPPAKCYTDQLLSYSTNEITLYWNSAMLLLMAQLLREDSKA